MPSAKYICDGKPVKNNGLQKLCTAPKSWLVSAKHTSKKSIDKYSDLEEQVPKNISHTYENINYKKPDQENITIIHLPGQSKKDDKLKIVIENFDKILTEFGTKKPPPKLQKSKTCSIIESKCILKKSISNPLVLESKSNLQSSLTKSLSNMDFDFGQTSFDKTGFAKIDFGKTESEAPPVRPARKHVIKSDTFTKTTPGSDKSKGKMQLNVQNPVKSSINQKNGPQTSKSVFGKDLTLSKTSSKFLDEEKCIKTTSNLQKSRFSTGSIKSNSSSIPMPISRMIKAKSSWDISKYRPSKIPIKSSLNKTLSPSIPSGLNQLLDRRPESMKDLEDVLRLQEKIAQQEKLLLEDRITVLSTDISANLRRVKSVANNIGLATNTKTLDKCITTGNRILKKVELMNEDVKKTPVKRGTTISVKNVVQKIESATKENSVKKVTSSKKEISVKDVKKTFGRSKFNYEARFLKSPDSLDSFSSEELSIRSNNIDQELIKYDLKTAREFFESINFATCDNFTSKDLHTNADIKIEKTPKLNQKEIKVVSVKNDGLIKRNFERVSNQNFDEKLSSKDLDKSKDYNSDYSDDSGNISNDLDLDCEIEEEILSDDQKKSLGMLVNDKNNLVTVKNCDAIAVVKPHFKEEIFFRAGVLGQLESRRDERLQGRVVSLQAHCRGYLARKRLQHRRLQDLAVRCIQRNVRKFMSVRDWPWWRLLVRVTPLLNVHRTEEQLKAKTEELELLRSKVEKLEQDRNNLKHENDKLEAKLSEMTADLAEEHSTSTLATERLDAETQERVRLERDLNDLQNKNRSLQQSSERLEMELLYARSDLNGLSEEDEDGDVDVGGVYKQRYERAARELEFTRRRLQQQHEDDLEQLVGLKKQLEKKLSDAYEEVEEQRQVVGQWKRKVQKLNAETNDLRLLLEEQNARNNLLEKKQRKFDSETQLLQDELRQEKQTKDRLAREKEIVLAEKYTLENNLADTRLELELQTDRLNSLQRELDEITFGGKTEEEVTLLRKQKMEMERKVHEQEEELDELAGQTQLLEQAKLRLEMALEQARKEAKREAQQRDEELEEVRCNAQKKVKAIESQLENEHEERTLLLREKHELERRLATAVEAERSERAGDEAVLQRLRRDLRRTKALLRDAQTMLERSRADSPGKAALRQLRHQLEDAECARDLAVKAKQTMEGELLDVQAQCEEMQRLRADYEERASAACRERGELRTQLEENEEELAEVLRKYKAAVQQMSLDQLALQEQVSLVSELETERSGLREQLAELHARLENAESLADPTSSLQVKRMELRCKELESKLELEQTTRSRLEVQITRLKETVDKLQTELAVTRTKEQQSQENIRKLQRSLRELRDEYSASASRENDYLQKRKDIEKRLEAADAETCSTKADLKLALKRIEDLQSAIQGELEDTISDHSESDPDSYSSDESIETFLANNKLSASRCSNKSSVKFDSSPK